MKLIILKENFIKGLSIIERATSKSLSLPILNNFLLTAEGNFINLMSTDLEIGIRWWCLTKIEKEGKIVLPSKSLIGLINYFPLKPIKIESQDSIVNLSCENYKTSIKGFNSEDFPLLPSVDKGDFLTVSSLDFCKSLKQVANFTALSQAKPEISGVYFVFKKDTLKMAATDSFRLGEKTLVLEKTTGLEKEYSLILPQKSAREIINIFGDTEREMKIYFSANQILLESKMEETDHPEVHFLSRLIEGEFPNYDTITPRKYETEVILPKDETLNQVKAASIFGGKMNEVKFRVDPEKAEIEISSEDPSVGEYKSTLGGKIKGKKMEISFNFKFLIDGLLSINDTAVFFGLTNEEGPALIRPLNKQDYFYILMPIKAT